MCTRVSGSLGLHPVDLEPQGQDPAFGHPSPFVPPLYIIVGGRGGSLARVIAVGSWKSMLVMGDLGPQPPSEMSLGLDMGRGAGAGSLGCSPYLLGLTTLPVPAPSHL